MELFTITLPEMFGYTLSYEATVGTLLTDIGLTSTLAGGMASGNAQAEAAYANADALNADAISAQSAAEDNALQIRKEKAREAENLTQQQARDRASRMAAAGASGVTMSGSPLQVMEGAAYMDAKDMDALLESYEDAEASALRSGSRTAQGYRNQANVYSRQGRTTSDNSWLNAASSTLSMGAMLLK
jgi:hypothetical protein